MKTVCKFHLATVDSTNSWAKKEAHRLQKDSLTRVSADHQTAGRGRFHRSWISPPGVNLYVSFCFFVREEEDCVFLFGQLLAQSVAQLLGTLGFSAILKQPNDLLISGKKIAGVLCETVSVGDRLCVIAGLGLNINMSADLLSLIDQPATSLFVESGKEQDAALILESLTECFRENLEQLLTHSP